MAWYYGTFACGHEGRVNIIGPTKDRQRKADRYFLNYCDECQEEEYEKEKQRKLEEAIKKATEYELPELQGTEKQIKWALTLRQIFIDKFERTLNEEFEFFKDVYRDELRKLTKDDLITIRDFILENRVKASYYIDTRYDKLIEFIRREKDAALKSTEERAFETEVKLENTVFPENKVTNAAVEISIVGNVVSATFEKNNEFRNIVKSLGFSWNGSEWERKTSETTGTAVDRAAELGNKLLNAGFPILIFDEEIRQKAINGDFEPECKRWIYRRVGTQKFAIKWNERNDSLYQKARTLPSAKWSSGSMLVDVAHYDAVEEFAELLGFKFTKAAKQMLNEYKEELQKAELVKPTKVEQEPEKDMLKEILESSDEILEDLIDD